MPFAQRVELAGHLLHVATAEVDALDQRHQLRPRLPPDVPELPGQCGIGHRPLDRDLEQCGVLDGEPPEHHHAGLDQVGCRVVGPRTGRDPPAQHLEAAHAEGDQEAVLGAVHAVDGARADTDTVRHPAHGQCGGALRLDQPFGLVEQRPGGLLVVLARSAGHRRCSISQRCFGMWYNATVLRNRRRFTMTPTFVLLHGLTFDRRMWQPVQAALPAGAEGLALDLPGHGATPPLPERGLEPVADWVHDAVSAAGIEAPIVVGHSIAGPIATIYAFEHPTAGVVSVDVSLHFEPFAAGLLAARPQLAGDGFDAAWGMFQESMQMDRVPAEHRELIARRRPRVAAGGAELPGRPAGAAAGRGGRRPRTGPGAAAGDRAALPGDLRQSDRSGGAGLVRRGAAPGRRSRCGRSATTSRSWPTRGGSRIG